MAGWTETRSTSAFDLLVCLIFLIYTFLIDGHSSVLQLHSVSYHIHVKTLSGINFGGWNPETGVPREGAERALKAQAGA